MEIRHGYTLDDLYRLAGTAVRRWGRAAADWSDIRQAAYDHILDMLIAAEQKPTPIDLMHAGRNGITSLVNSHRSAHGIRRDSHDANSAPHFLTYWLYWARATPSHEERVVERLTIPVLLAKLTHREQQVITAYAAYDGDRSAAARSLGLTPKGFRCMLLQARRHCARAWHEGETPRPPAHAEMDRRRYHRGVAPGAIRTPPPAELVQG